MTVLRSASTETTSCPRRSSASIYEAERAEAWPPSPSPCLERMRISAVSSIKRRASAVRKQCFSVPARMYFIVCPFFRGDRRRRLTGP